MLIYKLSGKRKGGGKVSYKKLRPCGQKIFQQPASCNCLILLVPPAGFEPATPGLGILCSIP